MAPGPTNPHERHNEFQPGHRRQQSSSRATSPQKMARGGFPGLDEPDEELREWKIGDRIGFGAFAIVYRAINWTNGQTAAIKRIDLVRNRDHKSSSHANPEPLGKTEVNNIMAEIELLKDLNHANIVKYHGFIKTDRHLHIILEYCENGCLHTLSKTHGKFPEQLAARFMHQVLSGLIYLHDQGVIHRDIKGANILLTKDGLVKLADFGVATGIAGNPRKPRKKKRTNDPDSHDEHDSLDSDDKDVPEVVGTPYWMAPEVVELAGASTASDIWSVGCTVIELLEGKPPYHQYQPLQALFRIVQDEHPPIPDSFSPSARDFLMQCFQKDPNLRISAKKLIRHPWISSNRRTETAKPTAATKYDEAVKSVQEWNEALKSPESTIRRGPLAHLPENVLPTSNLRLNIPSQIDSGFRKGEDPFQSKTDVFRSPDLAESDNWDDDFASSIRSDAMDLPHLKPIDKFDGALSPDKLKAYATVEPKSPGGFVDRSNLMNTFSSLEIHDLGMQDNNRTVRPHSPQKPQKHRQPSKSTQMSAKTSQRVPSEPKTQIFRVPAKPPTSHPGNHRQLVRSASLYRESSIEDYSDLINDDDIALDQKLSNIMKIKYSDGHIHPKSPRKNGDTGKSNSELLLAPYENLEVKSHKAHGGAMIPRIDSSLEIQKYAERLEDEDFSDVFGANESTILTTVDSESGSDSDMAAVLNSRVSTRAAAENDEDEDDPFLELEEDLDPMDTLTRAARDKYQSKVEYVEHLVSELRVPSTLEHDEHRAAMPRDDELAHLADTSGQLYSALYELPDLRSTVISAHGLLPILEVLEKCPHKDIALPLLKVLNLLMHDSLEILENFCFVGAIPTITRFASRKHTNEIRLETAAFVREVYTSSVSMFQTFISCGGLATLVDFLHDDYDTERDLVLIGLTGVSSVFELPGSTPKNDICRILSRSDILRPLSILLVRALEDKGATGDLVIGQIVNILLIFSQSENTVKERVTDRLILTTVLLNINRVTQKHKVTMLKFIKNLSMVESTLDSLHKAGTIERLTSLLQVSLEQPHSREVSNQALSILFNLCRLSRKRQEEAAVAGLIPVLQRIVKTERPLKELALPILCEMAHWSSFTRQTLWANKGLQFYVWLLADSYWQVTALDAIYIWLQEETFAVERQLNRDTAFRRAIQNCFVSSKTDVFENLLEPLQKILRLSPDVAKSLNGKEILIHALQRLHNKKPIARGNILRVIRSVCEASEPEHGLLEEYGLLDDVRQIAKSDSAALVRNLASELVKSADALSTMGVENNKHHHRSLRRTSSSNAAQTPPSLYTNSQPPTPSNSRGNASRGYFDLFEHPNTRTRASNNNGVTPTRPVSRDGSGGNSRLASDLSMTSSASSAIPVRSKLLRQSIIRPPRQSMAAASNASTPTPDPSAGSTKRDNGVLNPRRRRQTSGAESLAR